jgi:predicted phage baseplate assembly protein
MWSLSFDRAPRPFRRIDFDEAEPTVTVWGNLADASQGKAEREAVLGNGDNRQSWQTFPLPKAPLTYFLSNAGNPPHAPELEIWVEGRKWSRVDSFFSRGDKDEICIVREDADGRSFVQFGDGKTGRRLPSGLKNVLAVYRTGTGARGPIKPGSTPSASERPDGLDKVALAGIVSGGADPEHLDKAREAAPGKVQSLGRLVSIRDYETETLAIPGVVTATAAWDLHEGVPAVILRVLLAAGREAEFTNVRAAIVHAQRCHGPDRFPIVVQHALLRYAFLKVSYARDLSYRQEDIETALRAALGLTGDEAHERSGLFGLRARRLGEPEYASRIEGRLQNVPGVLWCRITAMGLLTAGVADVSSLVVPSPPYPAMTALPCSEHELLQLSALHLTLSPTAEATAGECA